MADDSAVNRETEFKTTIGRLQASNDNAMGKVELLTASNSQLTAELDKTKQQLNTQTVEASRLSRVRGEADNCTFVHRQIEETKQEIHETQFTLSADVWNAHSRESDDERAKVIGKSTA